MFVNIFEKSIFILIFRAEKENLRDMNSKLMDRLRHIWSSYKELNNKFQKINGFECLVASPSVEQEGQAIQRIEHTSIQNETFTQQYQQQQKVCFTATFNNQNFFLFFFLSLSLSLFLFYHSSFFHYFYIFVLFYSLTKNGNIFLTIEC